MDVDSQRRGEDVQFTTANNPEMKAFISSLLGKANKGEKINDVLLPGEELSDLPEPMDLDEVVEEKQDIQKPVKNKKKETSKMVDEKKERKDLVEISQKPEADVAKPPQVIYDTSLAFYSF